jgi:hypothetical protein
VTHACVRCGAPVAIEVGLCERCNPLGLRDSSASQVHGIAIGGVVAFVILMAIVARLALAGVGPFEGTVTNVVPDGNGLSVTLSVVNRGTSGGQTTCRISDPADRTGNLGGFILTPQIAPGQSATVTQQVTVLGATARPLAADCKSP